MRRARRQSHRCRSASRGSRPGNCSEFGDHVASSLPRSERMPLADLRYRRFAAAPSSRKTSRSIEKTARLGAQIEPVAVDSLARSDGAVAGPDQELPGIGSVRLCQVDVAAERVHEGVRYQPGRSSARLPIIRAVVASTSARSRSTTGPQGQECGTHQPASAGRRRRFE